MSKVKQRGLIEGSTRLYQQLIKSQEIAPVYIKQSHQTLIAAEQDAMTQASNAGYRCVVIETHGGRPRQSNVYVLVEGIWTKGDWRWGKWGKLSEKDKGGIKKVAPPPAPASPLAGTKARIEAVAPLWPEADSPEIEAMAKRLAELSALEPVGLSVPYTLDVGLV